MDELDPESKALFEAGRNALGATSADRERIRTLLSAKLGGAALIATSGVTAKAVGAAGTLAKVKALVLTQIGPALLLGAAVGGGVTFAIHSMVEDSKEAPAEIIVPRKTAQLPAPPPPEPALPEPSEATPSTPDVVVEQRRATAPSLRSKPRTETTPLRATEETARAKAAEAEPEQTSGLGTELQLIARMHTASRAGDWREVDRAIKTHEQRFPSGALAEEREAMKTIAACRRVAPERATELGANFAARHPSSTYAGRVKAACGAERK